MNYDNCYSDDTVENMQCKEPENTNVSVNERDLVNANHNVVVPNPNITGQGVKQGLQHI